jgi:hypothetical protein
MKTISLEEHLNRTKKPKQDRGEFFLQKRGTPMVTKILIDVEQLSYDEHVTLEAQIERKFNYGSKYRSDVDKKKRELEKADQLEEQQRDRDIENRKKLEAKPERRIISAWLGRYAYPQELTKTEKTYTIEDFRKVRQLAFNLKIPQLQSKQLISQFTSWCNAVIQEKQNPEPRNPSFLKKATSFLRH